PRGGETAGEVGRGDEAVGSDVPDFLCQGVVPPRRTQPPRQRCATRCREQCQRDDGDGRAPVPGRDDTPRLLTDLTGAHRALIFCAGPLLLTRGLTRFE